MLSKCGVNCRTDCRAYESECAGCNELKGRVSWAVYYGKDLCPIYQCLIDRGLNNCGVCGKAPCQIWIDTRNPDASDEEFAADIALRLRNWAEMQSP